MISSILSIWGRLKWLLKLITDKDFNFNRDSRKTWLRSHFNLQIKFNIPFPLPVKKGLSLHKKNIFWLTIRWIKRNIARKKHSIPRNIKLSWQWQTIPTPITITLTMFNNATKHLWPSRVRHLKQNLNNRYHFHKY